MRQFRDNYSGAVIFRRSAEEISTENALEEMRALRDEVVAERKRLEEIRKDGGSNGDEPQRDKDK